MFGISPALLIRGVIVVLVLGLATALYHEIKKAGANEQKIENLKGAIESLNGTIGKLRTDLDNEKALRAADQKTIKDRDATIDQINASHSQKVVQLKQTLNVARQSDECIDKMIPVKIQEAIWPAGTK